MEGKEAGVMFYKKYVPDIILSILATLALVVLTGFIETAPMKYGWPLPWLEILFTIPELKIPPVIIWPNFVIDFAFWFVLTSVVVFLVRKIRRGLA